MSSLIIGLDIGNSHITATLVRSGQSSDENLSIERDTLYSCSFENNIGHFFTKDIMKGKRVLLVFRWDTRDKENPIWSQALSEDNGITWEWNWYMYMSKIK